MNLPAPTNQPLRRSRSDAVIGGVVAGFARRLGIGATRLRIAFVAVSVLSAGFPGILVYLALWFLIPADS